MTDATWERYFRIRTESAFNAASPGSGGEWNDGKAGGANGWIDLPVTRESDGLQPKSTIIYPSTASGSRAMNAALHIAGAYPVELGTLEFAVYPELIDRILRLVFGSVSRTPTAGALLDTGGAMSIDADPKTLTPDTQSDGTEQVKFVIASTDSNTNATIEIIQGGSTLETISLDAGADCNGTHYSKGGYDGSASALSFKFTGMGAAGNVIITGVDKNTNVFTAGSTNPSAVIEQAGRVESGSNSEFHPGIVIPTLQLAYDRSAPDSLLMATATILGLNPTEAAATGYANDAAEYYKPWAGWTASLTVDGGAWSEVAAVNLTIQPNTEIYSVSSGTQSPSGKIEGEFEVFGTMTLLPADDTQWDAYRGQTIQDVHLTFTTPHYIIDTTGYSLLFELTQFSLEDYARNRQSMAQGAEIAFRTIYDSSDGPCKATVVSRMPV